MALYLVGLGLNLKSLNLEAVEVCKKADKIYLENYTVDFPYSISDIEKEIGKKIISGNREFVEEMQFLEEARKKDIVILVYGSPLTATTHITLINEAIKNKIKYKVIFNASILDAIASSGLQIYKFGKISSLPKWQKNFEPDSFIEIIKENQKIQAHSLLLVDIGLDILDAIRELKISAKRRKLKLNEIIVCSSLGTDKSKIFYDKIDAFTNMNVLKPYCIIIPAEMHFIEKEALESIKWAEK